MLFSEIIGHNSLKNRLVDTVSKQRISHTLLFHGKDGSENLSLALAYARYINCTNKQIPDYAELKGDSCGECPSCKKFNQLAHPDLHFIMPVANTKEVSSKAKSADFQAHFRDFVLNKKGYVSEDEWYNHIGIENKQGRIGVDDANDINKIASTTPYEGSYKVIIVWLAEKLYHAAAPKLLKVLEEPPSNTLFFLVTQNTDKILKTILSRTQLIKVPPHSDDEIRYWLSQYFSYPEQKLNYAVNLSAGNMKKTFELLEEGHSEDELLGNFRDLMLLCYNNKFLEVKEKVNELSSLGREKLKQLLSYGLRVIRLSLVYPLGSEKLLRASESEQAFVSKFTRFVNQNNAEQFMNHISQAVKHIERNGNSRIVLMDMSLQIILVFAREKTKKGS
jgi:DNA polymerase-3 subunit delta'